jgi:cell wall-associated NlpC family hydrolase
MHQDMRVDGLTVTVTRGALPPETHVFDTREELESRVTIIEYALSWLGTPFVDCADIRGKNGGVDCAMLLVRCYVDTGRMKPFDPRPYEPRHMMSSSEEKFLGWVAGRLGGRITETPKLGDLSIWQFGKCFSHGGVVINRREVVHAFGIVGSCIVSPMDHPTLSEVSLAGRRFPRPQRFYDVWNTRESRAV